MPRRRMESRGRAPHILNLNASWRWVATFTPRPLKLRGNSPRYPFDRRLKAGASESRFIFVTQNSI